MKKFFALLAVGLVMMTTAIDSAEAARRMGGGMNLGRQAPALRQATPAPQAPALRQNQQSNRQNAAQQQNTAGAAANAAKPSMMRNILMGAAAALGITALLSAFGLSEGVGQIIMIVLMAAALYFVLRMVLGLFAGRAAGNRSGAASRQTYTQTQREQPQASYSQAQPAAETSAASASTATAASVMPETMGARPGSVMDMFARQNAQVAQGEGAPALEVPAGFDFTTDELFIELTHSLRERGAAKQTSEVINLDAKLLGIAKMADANEHVAVVEFKGAMKIEGEFEEVRERWVLARKDDDSSGWLLAGIEQVTA